MKGSKGIRKCFSNLGREASFVNINPSTGDLKCKGVEIPAMVSWGNKVISGVN